MPAALLAEDRPAVAPALVEFQPDERQFRGRLLPGRQHAGTDAERHASGIGRPRPIAIPSSGWKRKKGARLEPMKARQAPENDVEPTRPRGRPTVRVMPDPIPDTPENVVRALCFRGRRSRPISGSS